MSEAGELETLLDEILEVEFSFRDTTAAATAIAALEPRQQAYVIGWVRRVASTNIELAYQYACNVVRALATMDREMVETWALLAMDAYDREGLRPARQLIRGLDDFIRIVRERAAGSLLEDNRAVLLGFLRGLSGRRLRIQEGEQAYTDTETLFLPPLLAVLPTPEANFQLYKATIALLWAQTRFGTFSTLLGAKLDQSPDEERLLVLFHSLETLRLEAIISRELPGLYRELKALKQVLGTANLPRGWERLRQLVEAEGCSADDVLELVEALHDELEPLPVLAHQGVLRLQAAGACVAARKKREKILFKVRMEQLLEELAEQEQASSSRGQRLETRTSVAPELPEGVRVDILIDGKPMPLPEEVQDLVSSIVMDMGEVPDQYLEPAGAGEYDPSLFQDEASETEDVWSGVYHEKGALLYQEWDYRRQHYRKNWCAAREQSVDPIADGFVESTLGKYRGMIKQLRKTFEAMRDENRLLKRQIQGDDVDLDALVEALADTRDGREMSDRLFTRQHRTERNIAVVFMVDMSGSTKGWINDAERESLVLLCEALESLGDRYAIYGFSSITRKRCEIYHVKHFNEVYDDKVKGRISGIQPKDYTRMGFAIRHLSRLLGEVDARTRILITLSDGKPDDYDEYRGAYGIEDTRRALIEARREGIHPYCITIDRQAREYLPHLYGPAAYTVVDEVRLLPLKVSDIYRRLTT